jgi:hypothetical protein
MCKIINRLFLAGSLIIMVSCGNNSPEAEQKSSSSKTEETTKQKGPQFPSDLVGNYHGVQPSYFMKNKYGDDLIINGNKVPVPAIDYKFLLNADNTVSLQQTSQEDNSRVYYEGTIKVLSENANSIQIECSLSDGKTSKPTYTLNINKADKKATCKGSNDPEFQLEKIK